MSRKAKSTSFDPRKKYAWDTGDQFTVSGEEIDNWNRAINVLLATDDFQRFLVIQKAAITMQNFLKEAVEEGLIKEAHDPQEMKVVTSEVDEKAVVEETVTEEVEN